MLELYLKSIFFLFRNAVTDEGLRPKRFITLLLFNFLSEVVCSQPPSTF